MRPEIQALLFPRGDMLPGLLPGYCGPLGDGGVLLTDVFTDDAGEPCAMVSRRPMESGDYVHCEPLCDLTLPLLRWDRPDAGDVRLMTCLDCGQDAAAVDAVECTARLREALTQTELEPWAVEDRR